MTAIDDRPQAEIANRRLRKDDQRLITPRTRWTDNPLLPRMPHLPFH